MIYRHYKGGLYYMIGYATPFQKTLPSESIVKKEIATIENTLEEITVATVVDNKMNNKFYAYQSNSIEGVQCFYRDLKGKLWLRPIELFFERLEDETPRFAKVSGEQLFNIISELN